MSLPGPYGIEQAYKLLLKKEARTKPASVAMRHNIIQAQNRSAYMNEYDRIHGIISGYADRFAGKHNIQQLKNRQSDLRRLFKESHEHNHPIQGKSDRKPFSVSSEQSITSSELRRI